MFTDWDPASEDAGPTPEHLQAEVQPLHELNTMEGSEFLDDSIRMKEQPLAPNEFGLL